LRIQDSGFRMRKGKKLKILNQKSQIEAEADELLLLIGPITLALAFSLALFFQNSNKFQFSITETSEALQISKNLFK
jgi:hypothetical protein